MKKTAILWIAALFAFIMSGCEFDNLESLLAPPKLSVQQQEIAKALQDKAGKNIKLRYPKSGDYRSAFVIADLDDEPSNEAIVFYENNSINKTSGNLRIEILDNKQNKWISVFSHPVPATDVEEIKVTKLGNSETPFIVVGYSALGQGDKIIEIYKFTSETVLSTVYTDYYTEMKLTNLNDDDQNELILFTVNNPEKASFARLLTYEDTNFNSDNIVQLNDQISKITNITEGYVSHGIPAVYIDGILIPDASEPITDTKKIQTQILYLSDEKLINPLTNSSQLMQATTRSSGYYSTDIDGDFIVEIPHMTECPGYESSENKLYFTDWYYFSRNSFIRKCSSYYNITNGYCFILPNRWQGTVTVKIDPQTEETVFYKYNGLVNDFMVELMRIDVCTAAKSDERLNSGYQRVASTGQVDYLVKLPENSSESLILTWSEIMFNFVNIT